jgi:peptidoglycan/LPS O-acetylase OafA/YrhL
MLATAGLALAMASSIAAAHLLYVWVEAPSSQWAARLKSAATTAAVPETAAPSVINSTVSV